jgi:hypothetical protein
LAPSLVCFPEHCPRLLELVMRCPASALPYLAQLSLESVLIQVWSFQAKPYWALPYLDPLFLKSLSDYSRFLFRIRPQFQFPHPHPFPPQSGGKPS